MIRTSQQYAEAFVKARHEGGVADDVLVASLLRIVDKHNDRRKLGAIASRIEELLIKERGGSHMIVTSARELSAEAHNIIENLSKDTDVITFSTDPSLVAGMKIAKDGEYELDYSFSRAINHLFI